MSRDFVIHPEIANLFRRWTPETKETNRKSFLESGILIPIVVWRDAKSYWWVIDGANRFGLWCELDDAGSKMNLPANEFVGTEREALAHARGLNSGRRNLSASALAATAVFCYHLDRKMEAREQGLKVPMPESDQGGVADRLAEEWSVSRTYIYDCMKLHESDKDVLDMVRLDEITVEKAKLAIERKAVGLTPTPAVPTQHQTQPIPQTQDDAPKQTPRKEAKEQTSKEAQGPTTIAPDESKPESNANVKNEPQGEPEVEQIVTDGIGEQVPRVYWPAFEARTDFKKVAKSLAGIGAELERMSNDPGGDYLRVQQLKADVRNLRKAVLDSQPHAICPTCRGVQSTPTKCNVCKNVGFLDLLQWRLVAKESGKPVPAEEIAA